MTESGGGSDKGDFMSIIRAMATIQSTSNLQDLKTRSSEALLWVEAGDGCHCLKAFLLGWGKQSKGSGFLGNKRVLRNYNLCSGTKQPH